MKTVEERVVGRTEVDALIDLLTPTMGFTDTACEASMLHKRPTASARHIGGPKNRICMLDTAAKVLENLLKSKLLSAFREARDLSPRQIGFRVVQSTINAIEEVIEVATKAENYS